MFRKWLNAVGIALLLTIVALAMSQAGPLEPSAPPGPTMKTLDEIPPTWSQILPTEQRYVVVMNEAAVLDKETGLVWDRSPAEATRSWEVALGFCGFKGGRGGFHLPTMAEGLSLGPLNGSEPFDFDCGDGNCVNLSSAARYWSSTGVPDGTQARWYSPAGRWALPIATSESHHVMCVRGGPGH
jgi:hypothetical protein